VNSTSIEFVLSKMGVRETKRNGEWITASCPLAPWTHAGGTDRRPSFGIRETTGISGAHCFSCGFHGGVLSLVRTYGQYAMEAGLMTNEDVRQLEDYVILTEDEDVVDKPVNRITEVVIPEKLRKCLGRTHPYFEKRGITDATIERWNLGYVEEFEDERTFTTMYDRVLFPVYEKEGLRYELKGIVGRSVTGEEPKYKNAPPNFKKAQYVYGGWLAEGKTKIAVVEGPVDCLVLNQHLEAAGMNDMFAVALLGADPSKAQIEWLKDHADEVVCMLDNDPSGKLGNKKLIEWLDAHVIVTVVQWKDEHKDPADAGAYAIEMLKSRKFVLEHKIEQMLRNRR
jgi:DNA primase